MPRTTKTQRHRRFAKQPTGRGRDPVKPPTSADEFPAADVVPINMAGAGVRVAVEKALRRLHQYDEGILSELGLTKRDIVKHRQSILMVLRSIALDSNMPCETNRAGAIAFLGEFGDETLIPDLAWILSSPTENASVRGWAAAALGRLGGPKATTVLAQHSTAESSAMRHRVVDGLANCRSPAAAQALKTIANKDSDAAVATAAFTAFETLAKELGLKLRAPKRRFPRLRARGGTTSQPTD